MRRVVKKNVEVNYVYRTNPTYQNDLNVRDNSNDPRINPNTRDGVLYDPFENKYVTLDDV